MHLTSWIHVEVATVLKDCRKETRRSYTSWSPIRSTFSAIAGSRSINSGNRGAPMNSTRAAAIYTELWRHSCSENGNTTDRWMAEESSSVLAGTRWRPTRPVSNMTYINWRSNASFSSRCGTASASSDRRLRVIPGHLRVYFVLKY